MEMACVNDDWERHMVNPLLQDMNCGDDEYFNTQDVKCLEGVRNDNKVKKSMSKNVSYYSYFIIMLHNSLITLLTTFSSNKK
ncbi:CLUMA_CG013581, isoform A [Clunio marinus]|uniref:CLUMA_CG013581, isoform A n=1 Tax=Clunio marinus TaxID=568069 RepID=A0A1J1IL74_9DIPT|nr:CLUMA_CG013581, isoform A [Clunio marinus]